MEYNNINLNAVFVEDPEGGYSAYIEEIQGVNAQGETLDEARENLKDALNRVLEANKALARKQHDPNKKSITEIIRFSA